MTDEPRIARGSLLDGPDDELVFAVTDPIDEAAGSPFDDPEALRRFTPGQRAIYAITYLDAEVNNGGFHQFFFNPTGALAAEALDGARHLGLEQHREVIEHAFSVFPGGEVPRDFDERLALHEALSQAEDELVVSCDDRWDELAGPEGDGLIVALAGFIRAKPSQFFHD